MGLKILVVGAGAVGGYFGARLLEAGEDVTFLVRPKRRQQLAETGLVVHSGKGDVSIASPALVDKDEGGAFDLILLSTKAHQLDHALNDLASFMHADTMILPLLNGIDHIYTLTEHFGEKAIVGGLCHIEATLTAEGNIWHTSSGHRLTFGELSGTESERVEKIAAAFEGTNADVRMSKNIIEEMWRKYLFIANLSGVTTLFNNAVGPIRESADGLAFTRRLIQEITTVMRQANAPITDDIEEKAWRQFMKLSDETTASMQKDMEKRLPVEVEHIQGYLLTLAKKYHVDTPYLQTVYTNLKIYAQH